MCISTSTSTITRTTLSTRRRVIGRPAVPVTHKDRLRSLETPPDTTVDEYFDRAKLNLKTLETALSSLWARSDGDPRPPRRGLKMDARWWFWSIQVALLPAYSIFFYCELIGKHEMKQYHDQKIEIQRKRALGILDVDETQQIKLLEQYTKSKPKNPIDTQNKTQTQNETQTQSHETQTQTSTPIATAINKPISSEAMAQRVQALEQQLLLLRAQENRRLQQAFQSGIERRHQDMALKSMFENSNETPFVPEGLGFVDKSLFQMVQQMEQIGGRIMKQGIDFIQSSWEQLSSQEQIETQNKMKDTNIYPPPEEKMINEVDDNDDATFADTIQSSLELLTLHDDMTFIADDTSTNTEQAIGVHNQQPDMWWKTWAVMTGASAPPRNETHQ